MKIKKAILPVAGFGTRFLPATKAQPKEMLPIFDTPAIQLIVQEAVEAGIEDIIMVTGRGKRAIEDHFDANFELEETLCEKNKEEELKLIRSISNMANFAYVRQPRPLGDGHALLCAKDFIGENEPVVVLFGDDIVKNKGGKNAVQQLIDIYDKTGSSVVLLEEVAKELVSQYGVVSYKKESEKYGLIEGFVEKPKPHEAPSNLGVVGKYIITPDVFNVLKNSQPSADGEIRLANAFMDYLKQGGELYGKILEGVRFDTGSKIGFLKATISMALEKEDIRGEFIDFLKKEINNL